MTLKPPSRAAHRRGMLKSLLSDGMYTASRAALGDIMQGYKDQGAKPSSGWRRAPRAHLVREKSSGMTSFDNSIDHLIASALTGGPITTGVLKGMFSIVPTLTGR